MKLNKVLALALSGVMAVSMLAGCSGNPGNGGQGGEGEGEQTPATIQIAADVNKAMTEDNQKKITFTDDGELQNQLATAVALNGIVSLPSHEKVQATMNSVTGIDSDFSAMTGNQLNKADKVVLVRKYDGTSKLDTQVNKFVKTEIDSWIATLPENNLSAGQTVENLTEGQTYVAYSYTGSVAVVEAPNAAETNSAYYFAVVISQNSTVVTKTAD